LPEWTWTGGIYTRAGYLFNDRLVFAVGGLKSLITGQLSVFEGGQHRLLHHFAGWQARVLAVVLILFGLVGLPLIGAPTWWWP
jgi:hypothetical protein